MPNHDHRCEAGHIFERFIARDQLDAQQYCECGKPAERVFLRFPMAWVSPDVCYDSPIDGRPITSMQQRKEDMARANCIEYDPEMRKDADRRQKEADENLDKSVDEFVDRQIATMPVRKREKLAAEMEAGLTAEPVRQTYSEAGGTVAAA